MSDCESRTFIDFKDFEKKEFEIKTNEFGGCKIAKCLFFFFCEFNFSRNLKLKKNTKYFYQYTSILHNYNQPIRSKVIL